MLLTKKYKPKTLTQIIGNDTEIKKIITWALDWQRGKKGKPLLIYGSTGVGKTSVAYALKHQFDWEILELNASDIRNKENTEKIIGIASENKSLFNNIRIILIDDVDKMSSTKDRGGTSAIATFIKTSKQPIILTVDDLWDRKISTLRNICTKIHLKKINRNSLKKYLNYIVEKESIDIAQEDIEKIVNVNSGDVRACLNDLQARNISSVRDRQISVFDALHKIFKTKNFSEIREASFNIDLDHDMFKLWIDENIPREYEKPEDICNAFEYLSKADLFDGRIIKRQYWGFLRYSTDLMTIGVALSKEEPYKKFILYNFPNYIQKMSATKSKREINKQISKKLKYRIRGSTKKIQDSFYIFSKLLQNNIKSGMQFYRLDISEVSYILGISETGVKKLLKQQESIKTPKETKKVKELDKPCEKEKLIENYSSNSQLNQFFK